MRTKVRTGEARCFWKALAAADASVAAVRGDDLIKRDVRLELLVVRLQEERAPHVLDAEVHHAMPHALGRRLVHLAQIDGQLHIEDVELRHRALRMGHHRVIEIMQHAIRWVFITGDKVTNGDRAQVARLNGIELFIGGQHFQTNRAQNLQ